MAFVIGDGSKNMSSGEAGATLEDKVILQSTLGKTIPQGVVPPYIEKEMASRFKMGADIISCMFATHYFFEAKEKFDGFLQNIAENLKIGGYFIGCCFDGEKTFEFLKGRESRQGMEGESLLWTITKKYDADEIPGGDEAFGMPIDVEFISIGVPHREYLVPFNLLTEKMRSIGCDLCSADDLAGLGLKTSTELFGDSHKVAAKAGRKFPMTPAVEQFSFLNRWFIFRRYGAAPAEPEAEGVQTAAKVSLRRSAATNATAAAQAPGNEQGPATAAAEQGPATAATAANGKKKYAAAELLQFFQEAAAQDRLKIGDATGLRWIAPGSPFPILDPVLPESGKADSYPSIEHFLAGMRYKVATDKPGLSQSMFGTQGSIHQKYLRQRAAEMGVGAGATALSDDRDAKLLVEEIKEVHDEMRLAAMKRWKAKFDEARWSAVKDDLLKEAVRQRWTKDARFRTVVEAAKQQGKTLLFYTGSASSEYGGKRTQDGTLEGENKLGKAIMEIAGFI
jgi:predicted NAD-dependent protein-ADP-ribosyltransferase YbiA (DUF1768 family)